MIRTLARFDFGRGCAGRSMLGDGWDTSGEHGVWLVAPSGTIDLAHNTTTADLALEVTIDPQVLHGTARPTECSISINGIACGSKNLSGRYQWRVPVPRSALSELLQVRISASVFDDTLPRLNLSVIKMVVFRPAVLPPLRVPLTELRFGWNDDGNAWLGTGWGKPEDEYAWAIGGVSTLRLPVLPDGSPQCVLLDMRPHLHPPSVTRQRVFVHAEGRSPMLIELQDRLINCIKFRATTGKTETLITFENQDANYETNDPFFHHGKPFSWALSSARIMPDLPRFYPSTRPPIPGSLALGTMRDGIFGRLGMSLSDVADSFISLGNCCEFGHLQRSEGRDRPGLLRLTAIRQRELVEGLFRGFEGIGRIEHLSYHDLGPDHEHWRIIEALYAISYATPYVKTEPWPVLEMERQSRRLARFSETLLDDIANGERSFIVRLPDPGAGEPAILALQAALRCFGHANVVWLVKDGLMPPGSADRLSCGIVRGHLEPVHVTFGTPPDTVASVMGNALILLRQAQPLPPS